MKYVVAVDNPAGKVPVVVRTTAVPVDGTVNPEAVHTSVAATAVNVPENAVTNKDNGAFCDLTAPGNASISTFLIKANPLCGESAIA